ncbi:MAG: hypothetical protein ABIJ95_00995 [Pseudomonadota bacterium]
MSELEETIVINVQVEVPAQAVKRIVDEVKKRVGPDERGIYQVDAFAEVSRMITRFLAQKDFPGWVEAGCRSGD